MGVAVVLLALIVVEGVDEDNGFLIFFLIHEFQ